MDIKYLKAIYKYKCMSVLQLFHLFHKDSCMSFNQFVDQVIYPALFQGDIEVDAIDGKSDFLLFLRTQGLHKLILNGEKCIYTAKQLKLSPVTYLHQLELVNCFILLETYLKDRWNLSSEVYHDKYTYILGKIIPDGLISCIDLDIFLEIDMGTERLKRLEERIDNYSKYTYQSQKNKKTIVLFIMYYATEHRKNKIFEIICGKKTLFLSNNIEFVITTKDRLLCSIDHYLLKQNYLLTAKQLFQSAGFTVVDQAMELNQYCADFYAFQTDSSNLLKICGDYPYHFLVRYCPFPYSVAKWSVLSTIYLKKYIEKFKKNIHMLLFTPQWESIIDERNLNGHYSIIVVDKDTFQSKINEVCP